MAQLKTRKVVRDSLYVSSTTYQCEDMEACRTYGRPPFYTHSPANHIPIKLKYITNMKQILTKITNGEVLTREQICQIVRHIADGEYNDVQISALLTGLIMRGIKVDEVLGLRDGLIETGQPVDFSLPGH